MQPESNTNLGLFIYRFSLLFTGGKTSIARHCRSRGLQIDESNCHVIPINFLVEVIYGYN